jgi:hypothetical protein
MPSGAASACTRSLLVTAPPMTIVESSDACEIAPYTDPAKLLCKSLEF